VAGRDGDGVVQGLSVEEGITMAAQWLRWELAGIAVIFFSGSALHFAFDWCGRAAIVAPFVPVNESVWEHLKMAFWPAVVYAATEYFAFGGDAAGFLAAKSAGVLLMPLCIVLLFYGYTALLGHHVLWLDILIFLVAVSAGQVGSYFLLAAERLDGGFGRLGLAAVALLGASFVAFTFRPPRLPIFRDSPTGTYGVQT
jgi:hypothetical protein